MATRGIVVAIVLAAIPSTGVCSPTTYPECASILPPQVVPTAKRHLTPDDLVRLRDIGPVEPTTFAAPFFTISPDGRHAAFQLRQADPQRNSYCVAMVIVDLERTNVATIVDEGREPLLWTHEDFRGIADFPSGLMKVITPAWSADGRWVAFLKRANGMTQVWRAPVDGSGSAPLTHSPVDVVDFALGANGTNILYATRPGIDRQARDNENEGLSGWHYDDRFVPSFSKRPFPRAPVPRTVAVLDLATGASRDARPDEAASVNTPHDIIAFGGEPAFVTAEGIAITSTNLMGGADPGALVARRPDGTRAVCGAPQCEGATSPWRIPNKDHVGFFRSEGWALATTAIYDWDVRSGSVRRLQATDDILSSCTPSGKFLLCLVDSSLEPRRLVRIDPRSGKRVTVFNPNPEFANLTLGKVERLHWRNASGLETIGDLVFPVNYQRGKTYPLIVVQYDTRGFLRGGTGDEYPIQAFADRGYAVLSYSHPHIDPAKAGTKNFDDLGRLDLKEFTYRRNLQSAIERGVQLVIDRGIADPKRTGITGLSDGSSSVEWELIHGSLFAAAAMSSCCWDPSFIAYTGPSAAKHFLYEGYPGVLGHDDPFWNDMALERNAHRLSTPILVHASDEEFLSALETYTGLREAGVPIDMFIYPNEYHTRWQPAHRLATYRRSLDWFDYWLRDVRSDTPERQSELEEWDRLKKEAGHGKPI